MRVLIFHGYLLRGTGSNVYNANLAAALRGLGHEVHLLSQERAAEELPWVDAIGSWRAGKLSVRVLREPVRCTVYRPEIGRLLPVYVADRYEGVQARLFAELSEGQLERYLTANVRAVADVARRVRPDVALANHLIMGPIVLARALAELGTPYAVKIHGSALEYTVKPHPRFLPYAREGLAGARGVLAGSRHTAESLWATIGDAMLPARTRLGPPGVDVSLFAPRSARAAASGVRALASRLAANPPARTSGDPARSDFAADPLEAARALESLDPDRDQLVCFVGKLIVSKGVDLLAAAWPLVLARVPTARLAIVGFGAYRRALERMLALLGAGDLAGVRTLARAGREAEGGPRAPLRLLEAFLDDLQGERRRRYLQASAALPGSVVLTGRLEHDALAELLPACAALVVPSTFPESFGMVAVEAAACGALPVCAEHSGLAEVTRTLAAALPPQARPWLSFDLARDPVGELAARLSDWLLAPAPLRRQVRRSLAATAAARYSWQGVAEGVLAAAQGRLDELAPVLGQRPGAGWGPPAERSDSVPAPAGTSPECSDRVPPDDAEGSG